MRLGQVERTWSAVSVCDVIEHAVDFTSILQGAVSVCNVIEHAIDFISIS